MFKSILAACAVVFAVPAAAAPPAPIEVMVLGTCHFGNPVQDPNNVKVDSVLTAQRQRGALRLASAPPSARTRRFPDHRTAP